MPLLLHPLPQPSSRQEPVYNTARHKIMTWILLQPKLDINHLERRNCVGSNGPTSPLVLTHMGSPPPNVNLILCQHIERDFEPFQLDISLWPFFFSNLSPLRAFYKSFPSKFIISLVMQFIYLANPIDIVKTSLNKILAPWQMRPNKKNKANEVRTKVNQPLKLLRKTPSNFKNTIRWVLCIWLQNVCIYIIFLFIILLSQPSSTCKSSSTCLIY